GFSAAPTTRTAPTSASPIQRSVTQPSSPGTFGSSPAGGGFFSRPGLLGGLAAGFLGAGLFGLLFGHGLFGGLGGLASMLGLLLQIGLVVIVASLAWRWWQRRQQPAMAGGPSLREIGGGGDGRGGGGRPLASGLGGFGQFGGGAGAYGGGVAPAMRPLELEPGDFDTFERLLGDVQTAYSREDLNALKAHATPEMVSYFAEDLAANASRG